MALVGRLKSEGIMQIYTAIDELSDPTRNAGVAENGIMYASLFNENLESSLEDNTPMRITNDKKVLVYNYFDERALTINNDVFDSLVALSPLLNAITSVTSTDFKNVQLTIEGLNSAFNVFAVTTKNANSELLSGFDSPTGKYSFTTPGFVYNSGYSYVLSTGNEIINMNNGGKYGLPEIDGKKWMAAAIYDGTTLGYLGIILWIFTNDVIDISDNVTSNGKIVTYTKDIFDPTLSSLNYMRIYQVILDPNGNVVASDTTGNAGWGFSDNQLPTSPLGYYATTQFSFDDGLWAYVLGGKVDGNAGPDYRTENGYGFGNYNNIDLTSSLYWAGSKVESDDFVGFIFTGDA